jgi:hypothetical protein
VNRKQERLKSTENEIDDHFETTSSAYWTRNLVLVLHSLAEKMRKLSGARTFFPLTVLPFQQSVRTMLCQPMSIASARSSTAARVPASWRRQQHAATIIQTVVHLAASCTTASVNYMSYCEHDENYNAKQF